MVNDDLEQRVRDRTSQLEKLNQDLKDKEVEITQLMLTDSLKAVSAIEIQNIEKGVTVSIGISQRQQGDTLDDIMHKSDMALYKSKENGRNCITFLIS